MLSFIEEAPFNGKPPKKLMIFLHGYGSNKEDLFSLKDSFFFFFQDTQFISVDGPDVCEFCGEGRLHKTCYETTRRSNQSGALPRRYHARNRKRFYHSLPRKRYRRGRDTYTACRHHRPGLGAGGTRSRLFRMDS